MLSSGLAKPTMNCHSGAVRKYPDDIASQQVNQSFTFRAPCKRIVLSTQSNAALEKASRTIIDTKSQHRRYL